MPLTEDRAEIAWAAGLFEGEGCISDSGGRVSLRLCTTDKDVLQRFVEAVGISRIRKAARLTKGGKHVWIWDLFGFERVQAIVASFWPWLGQRRCEKATEILKRSRFLKPRPKNKTHCSRGHLYQEGRKSSQGCRSCCRDNQRQFRARQKERQVA